MGAFENFFLEDNSKFSETKFERATMASAFKHGWNRDQKEEVMT
jgi:hypothetical protein